MPKGRSDGVWATGAAGTFLESWVLGRSWLKEGVKDAKGVCHIDCKGFRAGHGWAGAAGSKQS